MRKLFLWLDEHILVILSGFLLVFIPLYPKLPLFDVLPGYIVRVRLEDIFVAVTDTIFFIWLLRGKISIKSNPLFVSVCIYAGIGFLSILSALFITHTVPFQFIHIGKTFLHYLRRLEYMSLFFICFASIKDLKTLRVLTSTLIICALAIAVYGFGQRYLYWPAFSTMNREFAKGWMLYLTEHARVLSTFGGHYDLAAYTMMILILLWSLFFGVTRLWMKVGIFIVICASFWSLILTASRTSFLAYLGGLGIVFGFWAFRKGIKWSAIRLTTIVILSIVVMLSFGDLSERFTKLLKLNERLAGIKSLVMSPISGAPTDRAVFLENNPDAALAAITSSSDQPPTPMRPSDVYQDIPLMIPDASGSGSISAKPRTYSQTAFQYDLSSAIRFDALWPMAIKGFKRNPLLGTGYATLNKTQQDQFTEAESTDNDFLRNLGETGLLGFLAFFSMMFLMMYRLWRTIPILRNPFLFALSAGVCGLIFGMLVNAVYIDVFESSKVAFMFWGITGCTFAGLSLVHPDRKKSVPLPEIPEWRESWISIKTFLIQFLKSDRFFLLVLITLAFSLRLYKIQEPLGDWHSWRQADTSSVTRNYVHHGINILFPIYDDISSLASGKDNPKGLRYVEFPLYNMLSVVVDKIVVGYTVEVSGRLASVFASLGTMIFIFLIVRSYRGRWEAVLAACFFSSLPYAVFYSRVILPEPLLICLSTGMIYFFDRWIDLEKNKPELTRQRYVLYSLALIFSIGAVLVKPYAVFFFPVMVYLWFRAFGYSWKSWVLLGLFFVSVLAPFMWWRWWEAHFPEGIPANTWLLNGDGIRFKGAFFYWLFADRIGRLICGYWGITLLAAGFFAKHKKDGMLFFVWLAGSLSYLVVFATGNVRHDYYQVILLPIIVIFCARGMVFMISYAWEHRLWGAMLIPGICVVFMHMFGWYFIRDYYNVNHPEIVSAGQAVERKTPEKSLVVAPYGGDTAFLYQTHRAGWPLMEGSIDELIQKGAHYYVSVNMDDTTNLLLRDALQEDISKRRYTLVERTPEYVLIQLVPDKQLPK